MRWPRRAPDPAARERQRIIAAYIELVGTRGYRETHLALLLARAGVDRDAFERHFSGLEDCFCSAYLDLQQDFMLRAGAAFAGEDGWADRIRAIAYALLDFLREEPARAGFIFVEILYAGDRAVLIRDQSMQGLHPFIDLGRQELADPDSVSPDLAATIAGGIYNHIRAKVVAHRDEPEVWDRFVPQLMYSVVEPYLGAEAALAELHLPPPSRRPVAASP